MIGPDGFTLSSPTIGLAIPAIPVRADLLARALNSVCCQERQPDRVAVAIDHAREGATITRNRAWRMLGDVDLVAFLDDDDELLPEHLAKLESTLLETEADLVFPWFTVIGGVDPFPPEFEFDPWDPQHPRQTTITCLWRRDALERVGGYDEPGDQDDELGHRAGEDFAAVCRLNEAGGRIVHLPERTWLWHHNGRNTMGLPSRW